ncbi:hypothetical protein CDD80_3431 [Ophiocordyceps camponoti-rufipedis]|uniref:Uncharacterized protein n=1 Tax=Ophiocordyceps camponoti-rufipedis TaxID=2004952 RepID=A0A2C5XIU9_9HYPO|nr:hypothetical protein CDD80_3431 [Ophiocordyceps camponoti-rufipedis]
MASRKCEFRIIMPVNHRIYSTGFLPRSTSCIAPRSPRFHEDFEAPFSEAVLNASRTTFASDSSDGLQSSSQSRHSIDNDYKQQDCPPAPPSNWQSTEPSKRSSLNDRIREWAKRSLNFKRKGDDVQPHDPDDSKEPTDEEPPHDRADSGQSSISHAQG